MPITDIIWVKQQKLQGKKYSSGFLVFPKFDFLQIFSLYLIISRSRSKLPKFKRMNTDRKSTICASVQTDIRMFQHFAWLKTMLESSVHAVLEKLEYWLQRTAIYLKSCLEHSPIHTPSSSFMHACMCVFVHVCYGERLLALLTFKIFTDERRWWWSKWCKA